MGKRRLGLLSSPIRPHCPTANLKYVLSLSVLEWGKSLVLEARCCTQPCRPLTPLGRFPQDADRRSMWGAMAWWAMDWQGVCSVHERYR